MNTTETTQNHPPAVYTAMLRDYQRTAETVSRMEKELKQELQRVCTEPGSGRRRQELIRRILLLGEELGELRDAMHCIRAYAEREVQA